MSAWLSIRDLSVGFRPRQGGAPVPPVLRDVSLDLKRGEFLALVGASGAGKSVLAHAVLGLLPANAEATGAVRFEGDTLDARRLRALRGRRIALVPQSVTHLDPLLPVGRQVALAARRAGTADPGEEGFRRVGLDPALAGAYPHHLSGGMARRVLLLAALAGDPEVVLADEATDHLDPESAAIVLRTLKDVAERDGAVLLVTHDLPGVLPFATGVALLEGGRLVELERPEAFCEAGDDLISPYARRLWRALPMNGFGGTDA